MGLVDAGEDGRRCCAVGHDLSPGADYVEGQVLRCIQQPGMIVAIVSGEMKRTEDRLKDLDYW